MPIELHGKLSFFGKKTVKNPTNLVEALGSSF